MDDKCSRDSSFVTYSALQLNGERQATQLTHYSSIYASFKTHYGRNRSRMGG